MKKSQKQFLHSNYYKDGQFQALGTTYSLCWSCYTRKYFFGPFFFLPVRSAETTDRTKKTNSFLVSFDLFTFHYRPNTSFHQTRNMKQLLSHTSTLHILLYMSMLWNKKEFYLEWLEFFFFFLYFYSSNNQYNLVEWFWYTIWQKKKKKG